VEGEKQKEKNKAQPELEQPAEWQQPYQDEPKSVKRHEPTAIKREMTEKIVMPGESYEEEEVTAERERKEKKQLSKELGED